MGILRDLLSKNRQPNPYYDPTITAKRTGTSAVAGAATGGIAGTVVTAALAMLLEKNPGWGEYVNPKEFIGWGATIGAAVNGVLAGLFGGVKNWLKNR